MPRFNENVERLNHDLFCKSMLSDKDVAWDFVKHNLGEEKYKLLDPDYIEIVSESVVGHPLKEHRTDILIKVRIRKDFEKFLIYHSW